MFEKGDGCIVLLAERGTDFLLRWLNCLFEFAREIFLNFGPLIGRGLNCSSRIRSNLLWQLGQFLIKELRPRRRFNFFAPFLESTYRFLDRFVLPLYFPFLGFRNVGQSAIFRLQPALRIERRREVRDEAIVILLRDRVVFVVVAFRAV